MAYPQQSFSSVELAHSLPAESHVITHSFVEYGANKWVLIFSPDGKWLSRATASNAYNLWNTDGSLLRTLAEEELIKWAIFSPDGMKLAFFLEKQRQVKLLDILTGKISSYNDIYNASSAVFNNSNEQLCIAAFDKCFLIDIKKERQGKLKSSGKYIRGEAIFSPSGKLILFGVDNQLHLFNAETGDPIAVLTGHTKNLESFSFSHDETWIVSVGQDDNMILWDVSTANRLFTFEGKASNIISCYFSLDNKEIIGVGYQGQKLTRWNVEEKKYSNVFEIEKHAKTSVSFSKDYQLMLVKKTSAFDLYDLTEETPKKIITERKSDQCKFSFDDRKIWSAEKTGIAVIDVATGQELSKIEIPPSPNHCHRNNVSYKLTSSGKVLTYAYEDVSKLWDVTTGKFLAEMPNFSVFSPNGRWAVISEYNSSEKHYNFILWNIEKNAQERELGKVDLYSSSSIKFYFSSDSRFLISIDPSLMYVFDLNNGFLRKDYPSLGKSYEYSSKIFSKEADRAAIVLNGGGLVPLLWDVAQGKESSILLDEKNAHTQVVRRCVFSNNDQWLLSEGDDNALKLWDITTGKCIKTFPESKAAAFSLDDRWIVCRWENVIKVWEVESGMLQGACSLLDLYRQSKQAFTGDGITHLEFFSSGGMVEAVVCGTPNGVFTLIPLNVIFEKKSASFVNTSSMAISHNVLEQNAALELLQSAENKMKEKNYLGAVIDFSRVIELTPKAIYYSQRANIYVSLGEYVKALNDYGKAITLEKNVGFYYAQRADLYKLLKRYTEALNDYTNAINLEPSVVEHYLKRGALYQELKQYVAALADHQYVLRLRSQHSEAVKARDIALKAGFPFNKDPQVISFVHKDPTVSKNLEKHIQSGAVPVLPPVGFDFSTLDASHYDSRRYYNDAASFNSFQEKTRAHQQTLINAERREPRYTLLQWEAFLKKRARDYYSEDAFKQNFYSGNYQGAFDAVKIQGSRGQNNSAYYYQQAQAHQALHHHEQAILALDTLLQRNSNDAGAYLARGRSHAALKNYEAAMFDFNKTLTLRPAMLHSEAYFERGLLYKMSKNYPAATSDFNAAVQEREKDPQSSGFPQAYFELGLIANLLDDPASAIRYFSQAIMLSTAYSEAYFERGNVYRQMNNEVLAQKDFQRAIASDSSYSAKIVKSSSVLPTASVTKVNEVQTTIVSNIKICTASSVENQLTAYAQVIKEKNESMTVSSTQIAMAQKLMEQETLLQTRSRDYEQLQEQINQLEYSRLQQGDINATTQDQLNKLRAQQQLLLDDYWVARGIKAQQDTIAAEPALRMCYLRLQTKLNEFFVGAQAVASGQLTRAGTTAETVMSGISFLGSFASFIPGVDMITTVAGQAVSMYQDKKVEGKANHISELVVGLARMEANNEALARKMVLHYKKGLLQCTPESAGDIGEWAVKPVVGYLYQVDTQNVLSANDLVDNMFNAIKQVAAPKEQAKSSSVMQKFRQWLDSDTEFTLKEGRKCSIRLFLSQGIPDRIGRNIIPSFEQEGLPEEDDLNPRHQVKAALKELQAMRDSVPVAQLQAAAAVPSKTFLGNIKNKFGTVSRKAKKPVASADAASAEAASAKSATDAAFMY